MSRSSGLVKNFAVFALGSIGSKMLQFLLLPFYTRVLSDEQYGTVDILQSIGTLLLPIVSLTIFDAVFRFAMDGNTKKEEAFTIGMITVAIGTMLLLLCGIVLPEFIGYKKYIWLIVFYVSVQMFRSVTSQYIRAIGKVKLFTIDNMLQTLAILLFNILLMVVLHLGIEGYLLGYIIGNFISFLFVFISQKLWKDLKFKHIEKKTYSSMYKFSIPLIPNAICWWLTTMIGRIMVTAYLGADKNGLFAVAFKVPTIVTIVVGVFMQAWQISANNECTNYDFDEYNSKIFHVLQSVTFLMSAFLILCSKLIVSILDSSFYDAWHYIPVMMVGICFFTFAQFLGALYTASKKTIMAFVTNFTTAVINIVGNIILLPKIEVMGAAVSLALSYLFFWLFRAFDTRKLVKIHYDLKAMVLNLCLIILIMLVVIFEFEYWIFYGICIFFVMILVNFKTLLMLVREAVKIVKVCFNLKRSM